MHPKQMSGTENIHILPAWVWSSFVIVTVGLIALIYSRGNWRPMVTSMALTLLGLLLANESVHFYTYLNTHFIGGYDQLGIPFIQSHPGWSLLIAAWPLWLIPVVIVIILTAIVCILWNKYFSKNAAPVLTPEALLTNDTITTKFIGIEMKQQLNTVLDVINKQVEKNQNLGFEMISLEKQHHQTITQLQNKILDLNLEIENKETLIQHLMDEQITQAQKIIELTALVNKPK